MKMWLGIGSAAALLAVCPAVASTSVLTTTPTDARAVIVSAAGDGVADAAPAIQRAIDAAAERGGGGIVFLPSGTYRLGRTVFLWPGVRLFGTGTKRPVLTLGANTPGFQKGVANMVIFAGAKRNPAVTVPFPPPGSVPFDKSIADANPGTFYSALSNIDFRIGAGNPAAAAIRFHSAQHSFVSHADFDIGSGLAGLYQVGNLGEGLNFRGGRYGILTEKTSPAWPFSLIDSTFEGQRDAAIREHEVALTLVNVAISNTPVGIEIDRGYGDWLWGQDVRFSNVRKAGVLISNEGNVFTQVGFQNVAATATPTFARFRDSGRTVAGKGPAYKVASFSYGLTVPALGQMGRYETRFDAAPGSMPAPARVVRPLPPVAEWTDVRSLGAKGDDRTDDTEVLQKAIDAHRVVYLPTGFYRVSDTLRLRPDTVLVGLHPSLTRIVLADRTPSFQGVGTPKALVASAVGGDAVVTGIGLDTGGINARATALLWKAGVQSQVTDVKFQQGHGTDRFDGTRVMPTDATGGGDPDPARRWASQYASLWVTEGGGGTFVNLWSPSTFANPGIMVSDTETPGRIIQASVEHHTRSEITLNRVANWELIAPQTEEEAGESEDAVALEIRNSRNILVANLHAYRVTRTRKPAPAAVTLYNSSDIRFRNLHVNAESGLGVCDEGGCANFLRLSRYPFDNAVRDVTNGIDVRERQVAVLDVPARSAPVPAATFGGAVDKLADGFFSIGGGAVDASGTLYFADRRQQRIYSWSAEQRLGIVRDAAHDPVNLAVDRSGNLLVLSYEGRHGTVYSFKPGSPDTVLTTIAPTPVGAHDGASVLPANWWVNGEFRDQLDPRTYEFTTLAEMFVRDMAIPKPQEYLSPDGSLALPAFRVFQQGPSDYRGFRFSDSLDTYGFVVGKPGERVFVTNSTENRTYSGRVGKSGTVTDLRVFAQRGGESVATDADGRVFVANGQVFVYGRDGAELGRIDVPERPLQLIFGGQGGKTLFILAHHGLYAWTPK